MKRARSSRVHEASCRRRHGRAHASRGLSAGAARDVVGPAPEHLLAALGGLRLALSSSKPPKKFLGARVARSPAERVHHAADVVLLHRPRRVAVERLLEVGAPRLAAPLRRSPRLPATAASTEAASRRPSPRAAAGSTPSPPRGRARGPSPRGPRAPSSSANFPVPPGPEQYLHRVLRRRRGVAASREHTPRRPRVDVVRLTQSRRAPRSRRRIEPRRGLPTPGVGAHPRRPPSASQPEARRSRTPDGCR